MIDLGLMALRTPPVPPGSAPSIPPPRGADATDRPPAGIADARPDRRSPALPTAPPAWWVTAFLASAFCLQIGLFFLGGTASLRLPLRIGVYGLSVGLLFIVRGRSRPHPAWGWAQAAIVILVVGMLNASGDSMVSRVATVVLYTSVLAPLLWVGRLRMGLGDVRTVLRVMWAFYTLSALVGVLQVNYPGRFEGALTSNYDAAAIAQHVLQLADGRRIIRPMGLTDTPGGASTGGLNAIVLGSGLLLTETSLLLRAMTVGGMVGGLFCIYICQERVNLVVVGIATLVLLLLLVRRRAAGRAATLLSVAVGVALVGTTLAFAMGGESVVDRFRTLIASDAGTVYQQNRGSFLDEVIHEDVFLYPLGAGQGRWGMINNYFGSSDRSLWAEMLWQSLVYDGGVPLIAAYLGLFGALLWAAWQIAGASRSEVVGTWAAVIVGYNVAALAATFVYPLMAVQTGMEVVLLNACLYGVNRTATDDGRRPAASSATRSRAAASAGTGSVTARSTPQADDTVPIDAPPAGAAPARVSPEATHLR